MYWRHILTFPSDDRTLFYMGASESCKSLADCRARAEPSFLSSGVWVLVRLQESNLWPPALQSSTLICQLLILPQLNLAIKLIRAVNSPRLQILSIDEEGIWQMTSCRMAYDIICANNTHWLWSTYTTENSSYLATLLPKLKWHTRVYKDTFHVNSKML